MCHTSINLMGARRSSSVFAGGLIALQNWYAPSLTNDTEFGLDELARAGADRPAAGQRVDARHGVRADGRRSPQQPTVICRTTPRAGCQVHLKSIPQKGNAPINLQYQPSQKFGELAMAPPARASSLVYPSLAGNYSIMMGSAVNPIRMVLNGGYPPSTFRNLRPYRMPPFAQALLHQ